MPEENEEKEDDDEEEEQEDDEEEQEDDDAKEQAEADDEDWSEARSIFGKLVGINKKDQTLSIEYKSPNGEWETETFSTEDFTDEQYEGLRRSLGGDITVNVVDDAVDSWEAE